MKDKGGLAISRLKSTKFRGWKEDKERFRLSLDDDLDLLVEEMNFIFETKRRRCISFWRCMDNYMIEDYILGGKNFA